MIQLTTEDVGFVREIDVLNTLDPTTTATRRFVVLAYRPAWDFMLFEDTGAELVWICDLPGHKDSTVDVVAGANLLTFYIGTRLVDATGVPCTLVRHDEPIAGIQPIDVTALKRIRNIARIVSKYLPAAAVAELHPYTL